MEAPRWSNASNTNRTSGSQGRSLTKTFPKSPDDEHIVSLIRWRSTFPRKAAVTDTTEPSGELGKNAAARANHNQPNRQFKLRRTRFWFMNNWESYSFPTSVRKYTPHSCLRLWAVVETSGPVFPNKDRPDPRPTFCLYRIAVKGPKVCITWQIRVQNFLNKS